MYLIDFGQVLGRTMTNYKKRFFESSGYMGYKHEPRKGAEKDIHELISDRVISMRAEDYLSLPERIDLVQKVDLPAATLKSYVDFEKTLLVELDNSEFVEASTAAVLANKLLQWCNGAVYIDDMKNWREVHKAKLDALADIVEDNAGENILVAYNYKTDLERLKAKFPAAVVLDNNPETVKKWNDGDTPMLLAHPASAGHGLNLQRGGALAVWFGLNWSLELYQQFNARLHRQGQTRPVRIVHIAANGCLDERVMGVLSDKEATQDRLINALIS
jgi:SNF2 family DNA or RNA helicase